SGLALATPYFAFFTVAPEALWLLVSSGRTVRVVWATASVAAVGGALAPLALAQRSNASWITEVSRGRRLYEVAKEFLVGPQALHARAASGLAGFLVLIGVVLVFVYGQERARRAIVVHPDAGLDPLLVYRRGARPFTARGARVREVVIVAIGRSRGELGRNGRFPLPPKRFFHIVQRVEGRYFTELRLRSSEPRL